MKKIGCLLFMGAILTACENIPDCAYDDNCTQVLENRSAQDFSSEPFEVLTMKGRADLPDYFQIYQVQSPYRYPAGTIVVDTPNRVLYLIEEQDLARRYPIAVGKEGYQFEGQATVGRKTHWPTWRPTPDMFEKNPDLEEEVLGGPKNPLGARAIYLYDNGRDTLYRIHGTNSPRSIGRQASSGCIRMYNEDVIDLYDRVEKGANVVVIGLDNVPEDVEVDVIGAGQEPLQERELTFWEGVFYDMKKQGKSTEEAQEAADEAATKAGEDVATEAEVAQAEAEAFNLFEWLAENSKTEAVVEETAETVAE